MSGEVALGVGGGLLLLLAFIGVGGAILRGGRSSEEPGALASVPVAGALGFAAYGFLSYPVIALGSPPAWLLLLLIGSGILLGLRYWSAALRELSAALRSHSAAFRSPLVWAFGALGLGLVALVALNAMSPPKEGDALEGYLFTARWLYRHGFAYSPFNPRYSLMPIHTELLYSWSFAFGTDLVAKAMDFLLALLFLLGLFEFARRYASPAFAFFSAACLASMTAFVTNWANGKVDVTCAFVLFSAFSLLYSERGAPSTRTLLLASVLAGTACAQKYTAWILLPGFLLAIALRGREASSRRALAGVAAASGVILVCLVPHLVRDTLVTGNPVAPFARNLVPTRNVYLGHASDAIREGSNLVRLPVTLFLAGDDGRKPGPIPLLVLVGCLGLLVGRPERIPRQIFVVAVFQLAVWVIVRRADWLVPRFLLCPVALLLVVSAHGAELLSRRSRLLRWTVVVLVAFTLFRLGVWSNRHFRENLPFVAGRESRSEWQARTVPHRGYPALQALAPRLDANHRLLIGASLYNLPEEKLPFASTEKELAEFAELGPGARTPYLRSHRFAYVYETLYDKVAGTPEWARNAKVLAGAKDWFILYSLGDTGS
jgi:hypothetical protein